MNISGSRPLLYDKKPRPEAKGAITITDNAFATKHEKKISSISLIEPLNIEKVIMNVINVAKTLEKIERFITDARIE